MRKEENATKLETKLLLVVRNFLKIPGWASTNDMNCGII